VLSSKCKPNWSAQDRTTASIAIGTPGYMPTEQGQGKPRPNSDIYALGIIGIQALTKMSPMQLLQTRRSPMGELIWQHLVPVSPGWRRYCQRRCATTSKTATSQQRNAPSVAATRLHPYPASENTTWYHWNLCRHKLPYLDTTTSQLLRITQSPSRFKEWSGCGC